MTNKFRLNTFLKILIVLIIGYFVFDLLFGIIIGNFGMGESVGGASGHHGASSGGTPSYSFDMIINALLILLLKLMVVLFFIILMAGVAKWIKLLWNENVKPNQKSSSNTSLGFNSCLIITGVVISLLIFFSILKGFNFGGMSDTLNTSMNYGMSNYSYHNNFNIDVILGVFVNVILYIVAVILGLEIFLYLKKILDSSRKISVNNENSKK